MHTKSVVLSLVGLLSLASACDYGADEAALEETPLFAGEAGDDIWSHARSSECVISSIEAREDLYLVLKVEKRKDAAEGDGLPKFEPTSRHPEKVARGGKVRGARIDGQIWFVSKDWMRVYVGYAVNRSSTSQSSSYSEGGRSQTFTRDNQVVDLYIADTPTYDFTPPPPPAEPVEGEQQQQPLGVPRFVPNAQTQQDSWQPGRPRSWGQGAGSRDTEQLQVIPQRQQPRQTAPAPEQRNDRSQQQPEERRGTTSGELAPSRDVIRRGKVESGWSQSPSNTQGPELPRPIPQANKRSY